MLYCDILIPEVRPKEEVVDSRKDRLDADEDEPTDVFTSQEIVRTTRLARTHGFGAFDSGRAQNATYPIVGFGPVEIIYT